MNEPEPWGPWGQQPAGATLPARETAKRGPMVAAIVAGFVVLALVIVGAMALSGGDTSAPAPQGATGTTLVVEGPVIPAETLFAPISGYTFGELPPGALDVARSPFDSLPHLQGTLKDLSGRTVLRDDEAVAAALVYQFKESFTSNPAYPDGYFGGISGYASTSEDVTVEGLRGVLYTVGTTFTGLTVLHGNVAILVQGPLDISRTRLEQIVAGLMENVPHGG